MRLSPERSEGDGGAYGESGKRVMQMHILWIEDETKLLHECKAYLEAAEGYKVTGAASYAEALPVLAGDKPDLLIVDWMLPGGTTGLDICKRNAREWQLPVIMVTAKGDEFDKVLALEIGADDYLTKPFGLRELSARIKAVMRRAGTGGVREERSGEAPIRRGPLVIDSLRMEVKLDGRPVDLTRTEFQLLAKLAAQPGRAFTRLQLMDEALGDSFAGYERTLDSHIRNIRRKLGDDPAEPRFILTVYGIGYKFAEGV